MFGCGEMFPCMRLLCVSSVGLMAYRRAWVIFYYCFNPGGGEQVPRPLAATLTQTAWGSRSIGTGFFTKNSKPPVFLPISLQFTYLLTRLESPLDIKEIKPVNPKGNQPWIFTGRTWHWSRSSNILTTWSEEPTHWKRPWCWWRLRAGGEGGDRGWDGWLASPTQWTWIWANSRRQGSLACCSPWGHKQLDTTGWLNNNNLPNKCSRSLSYLLGYRSEQGVPAPLEHLLDVEDRKQTNKKTQMIPFQVILYVQQRRKYTAWCERKQTIPPTEIHTLAAVRGMGSRHLHC